MEILCSGRRRSGKTCCSSICKNCRHCKALNAIKCLFVTLINRSFRRCFLNYCVISNWFSELFLIEMNVLHLYNMCDITQLCVVILCWKWALNLIWPEKCGSLWVLSKLSYSSLSCSRSAVVERLGCSISFYCSVGSYIFIAGVWNVWMLTFPKTSLHTYPF